MTFIEKAQELMKGCRICRDNRQFEKDKGLNVGSACDSDEAKISQMREDLQAFKEILEKNITLLNFEPAYYTRIKETYIKKVEDISQALKVLDGGEK